MSLSLQRSQHTIEHTLTGLAASTRLSRVPMAKRLWQTSPFTAVLRHILAGVQHLPVGWPDVTAPPREQISDLLKLRSGNFLPRTLSILVLAGPRGADQLFGKRDPYW